jgi:hypothetical protein
VRETVIQEPTFYPPAPNNKDAASRRLLLMSFEGMGKSIRTIGASIQTTDAPFSSSDEFPAGYSLTGCSPALPAAASPAGDRICFQAWPSQGMFNEELPTEEELIAMND